MTPVQHSLHVVPRPEKVEIRRGVYTIPDNAVITISSNGKEMRFAASLLAKSIRSVGRRARVVTASRKSSRCWLRVSDARGPLSSKRTLTSMGNEGYVLDIADGIDLQANSPAGVFYGVQTLIQEIDAGRGKLPNCTVRDKPSIPLRGVMADLGRLKEKDEYYFKLIDFISQYKFNAIFLHLTDDQGAPIVLKRHPELASAHPLTAETVKRMVQYAAERHVEVIPEMEVWGHAGWITKHYPDISEEGPDLCTMNPKTWKLIADIFDDVCEMFPSKYIHGGSDEANFGLCTKCKAEIEKNGKLSIVGTHVKKTAEIIHAHGRIPIIWADIVLNYPGSEDMIPKYAILNHWYYRAEVPDEPVKRLMGKGFQVMGGSAIVFGSRAVLPKGDALQNVESFGAVCRKHKLPGINNTIWVPQRYVSDTLWYGIALAGEASWSSGAPDRNGLTSSFFKSFFGIDAGKDLLEAVTTLHELAAYVGNEVMGVWKNKKEFDQFASPEEHKKREEYLVSASSVLQILEAYRPKVLRHKWEYSALIYAAQMKVYIGDRSSEPGRVTETVEKAKALAAQGQTSAAADVLSLHARLLTSTAGREKAMADLTEKYWDHWRYVDDPVKSQPFQNTLRAMRTSDGYIKIISERLRGASRTLSQGGAPDWASLLSE